MNIHTKYTTFRWNSSWTSNCWSLHKKQNNPSN